MRSSAQDINFIYILTTIVFNLIFSLTGGEYVDQQKIQRTLSTTSGSSTGRSDGISRNVISGGASGSHESGYHNGYPIEPRNSYAMLSQAMSQAVIHEFNVPGSGSADSACLNDDLDCLGNISDRLGMEAIRQLHRQLDDDDNGNIDIAESDDFLREELKYDSGYEKRHRAFHYNDDMHISVKELWEAWLRSEVHNWTIEQTTEWLAQSVQLPQYVDIFKQHKVTGASLPRLAVNNMHYVGNILGIRDPIHKQKIALKAMDVVLFGPPRETGNRWKDYVLVTLLLSAIIGCWYAYQQNKNAKNHLKRMAQDMEGLQKAEKALEELQTELERARMEQENAASEKMDLLRRLKEAPSLSSSSSDLEVQHLKQEIEMLRNELSRAEGELVDHCWAPPQGLQSWLQLTYELESRYHLKKRLQAEKQLQMARDACEKLRKKRSSLVGAFVSTHGKSIDDVDRSIVEARNALSEVTNELQERMHRWKQMEILLGFSIINNNGISYLENVLYNRNGSGKSASRSRITSSQDDLDDDSPQGLVDNCGRIIFEDSSASDDGDSVTFVVGTTVVPSTQYLTQQSNTSTSTAPLNITDKIAPPPSPNLTNQINSTESLNNISYGDDNRQNQTFERIVPLPRTKKLGQQMSLNYIRAPLPPPRRANFHQSASITSQMARAESSTDVVSMESQAQPESTTTSADPLLEDTCSTDSSSIDDEHKRRRRKLHFPFGKKKTKLL